VFLLPWLGSFFAMLAPEERVGGGYDLVFSPNGQLKPIFRRLAYGLLGLASSVTVDTSASEENERDLPPKKFDKPGLLMGRDSSKADIMVVKGPRYTDCASSPPVSPEEHEPLSSLA
jgi:hypothetical protein